jgi:hypothetical protein
MFVIQGLLPEVFAHYFTMSDAELVARGARRVIADGPGYPCRVSLVDASPGDELVLCSYAHHPVASPYRGAGPLYARRAATRARYLDVVPPALASRLLSVRGYSEDGDLHAAEVVPGAELAAYLVRVLADPAIAFVHAHNARPGCFAARIDRG